MHNVPLNSLDGKDNLPSKKPDSYNMPEDWIFGYNRAIRDTNQCTVGLDEDNILEIIGQAYCTKENEYKVVDVNLCVAIAKIIASKPQLVIKIGKL